MGDIAGNIMLFRFAEVCLQNSRAHVKTLHKNILRNKQYIKQLAVIEVTEALMVHTIFLACIIASYFSIIC